ncbi:hypothetical protein GCM10010317_052320 [Streptomyces mirabilis]|nr:hypothetical protein GCM10010317_052320 [Streptomyces mirabilis]
MVRDGSPVMDTFEWAVAILAVTICFGPGLAAVTTDWLFPWLRGSIARPRLWGWGELMAVADLSYPSAARRRPVSPPTTASCRATDQKGARAPAVPDRPVADGES